MKNKRKLLFRIAALLIVLAVAGTMFVIGRGHTIYFDNKETTRNLQSSPKETGEWRNSWDRRSR